MDNDATEQAMYQRDLETFQREALDALQASQVRTLTKDEAMLLAWLGGLSTEFYKALPNRS